MARKQLPVTWEEFKAICDAHGYRSVNQQEYKQKQNIFAAFTNNGTKAEIKPEKYTVGFGRTDEERLVIREELTAKGYNVHPDTGKTFIDIDLNLESVMAGFIDLMTVLDDIQGLVRRRHEGATTKVFTREQNENEIFMKIAKRYRHAIDNQDQDMLDLARQLLNGDSIDHIITRGESQSRTPLDTYREHIVPCVMIHNHAIKMTQENESLTKIAHMIATNLAIVLISNAEQQLLDIELGWRTTMPDGWEFGQDPFARITGANIQLK